jgi:hypothetical protein
VRGTRTAGEGEGWRRDGARRGDVYAQVVWLQGQGRGGVSQCEREGERGRRRGERAGSGDESGWPRQAGGWASSVEHQWSHGSISTMTNIANASVRTINCRPVELAKDS